MALKEVEEMPVFHPTEDEFKSPMDYLDHLWHEHGVADFGCIKIVPPASFKPTLAFDTESDAKLPTRYQVL